MSKLTCREKLNTSSKKQFVKSYFWHKAPATFDENGNLQCDNNRNRSILDLKMLIDGHFKRETAIDDVIVLLVGLVLKRNIKALYCPTIRKVVFCNKNKNYYHFMYDAPARGVIGLDGYSWNQMLQIYNDKINE